MAWALQYEHFGTKFYFKFQTFMYKMKHIKLPRYLN